MGKTVTPPYRLEWTEKNQQYTERHQTTWSAKEPGKGKATADNAIRYLRHYEASTKEGGCNSHIGERRVISFSLINQKTGNPVVSGKMGLTFTA